MRQLRRGTTKKMAASPIPASLRPPRASASPMTALPTFPPQVGSAKMPSPGLKKARMPKTKTIQAIMPSHRFQLRRKPGTCRRHAINNRSKITSAGRVMPTPKALRRLSQAVSSPETTEELK